ncbi:zinc ribbon domain-containing protein [Peptoniphilus raoultii]|uniref:zinc ribbon domain-containing protein n=1 Tax=Peptoniphilus raoultii TaxID=1776387 RepID=UPI0008D95951|nr:zinc ribbon domain-containing protein [Peptoniphilus raoultii]
MANDAFEKIKSSFNRGITSISIKTSSSLEKGKINTYIDSLENEIKKIKYDLGEEVFRAYIEEDEDRDKINAFFSKIKESYDNIDEAKKEIEAIDERDRKIFGEEEKLRNSGVPMEEDSVIFCDKCGARYEEKVNFCRKCGNKLF